MKNATVPQPEMYKVLRLVHRESTAGLTSGAEHKPAVDFCNAQGSLRLVDDGEIRQLARQSTEALLTTLAKGDDTSTI